MDRIKIHWASDIYGQSVGNGYGYRVHCTNMHRELSRIADLTESAEDVLLIASPEFITKFPGKRLFLFSMFEGRIIPDRYLEKMRWADYWIAPSKWVARLFEQYFPKDRVFVCNHGVEPVFTFKQRRTPYYALGEKFRFLWVGAPNPRKGYEAAIHVWTQCGLISHPHLELYMKSTMQDRSEGGIQRKGNIILDRRNIPQEELVQLYHDSHCFLSPHMGEGFSLVGAEAMATGIPCIMTNYSGVKDFFDKDVGYPIGYTIGKGAVKFIGDGFKADTELAIPDLDDLAEQMLAVYSNYDKALRKGKLGSERIKKNFTWEKSAQKIVDIITSTKLGYANTLI